ncbi:MULTISPECIES: hypothetical protein [unclassified Chryseobacterium]|uniref:hypothetical protein n=1 Tax=unclassified Chryseobacterium TaxID=2593645 RepID=UPI000D34FA93|nr:MULTISPECIES: hypothetical protein [unclassified Chryseobacterium]PTT67357.1 hypothetical protein DBR25_21280 [Chryseobacterium sp. HMWF001]PVV56553.1 hypothetical protein DD829_10685 [Chryseobacterium sp. HMWF035]
MKDIKNFFTSKDIAERIDFLQFGFFAEAEKSSEKELNILLSTIILDSDENTYVQKLAIERLMDLIFFNRLKPRQALTILIDSWESFDISLNTTRIKSLYYLFEYEKDDIENIFQQYLASQEAELSAEASFHLGLIDMQKGMLAHDITSSISALEKSRSEFLMSGNSIENRVDAHVLYRVIDLTINILNNITYSLKECLKEIGEMLFKMESFTFNFKDGPFYIGFYRVLVALVKISDKNTHSWLDYRAELFSLFEQYAIIKDQEIKNRLTLSELSRGFLEKLNSAFFEPYFALNFSAERSRIEVRLNELPSDSQESSFLKNLLAFLEADPKKKAFSDSLRSQLKQVFLFASDATIAALEEKYAGEDERSQLLKIYRELSKPSAEQLDDTILKSCLLMQGNRIYYGNYLEDDRNTFITSMLESAGFRVKDQTRKSTTETGKSAGEVDIFIQDIDGFPIGIIEALNLSSVKKDYIVTHIDKIFIYDANGLPDNYILVYANVKDFGSFYSRYRDFVKSHNFKYPLVSLTEDNAVEYSEMKKFTIMHNRNNMMVNMHHIVMNLSGKKNNCTL